MLSTAEGEKLLSVCLCMLLPLYALAGLSGFNEETDERRLRRELTEEELRWLLSTTESEDRQNYRLDGTTRGMVYRVAIGTGFRANELRKLAPASFDVSSDPATVTVDAAYSKRRQKDVQPIRADLAETLRPWLAGRSRDEQLFRLPKNTAKMLRRDLAAARRAWIAKVEGDEKETSRRVESYFLRYEDEIGRVADFHALRHTYISGIVAGGASVKTAQELARHSTPVLTIGRYSHTRLHDLRGALDALPNLAAETQVDECQAQRATGTDARDATPANDDSSGGGTSGGNNAAKPGVQVANVGEATHSHETHEARLNVLQMNQLGEV